MTTTPDLEVAKDRLVDTLSTARDATRTAVKDDIAPAVVAALGAAREASGPLRAEAAARAGEAASRAGDAAKVVRKSDLAKKAQQRAAEVTGRRKRSRGKKLGVIAGLVALGAAAFAVLKRGATPNGPSTNAYPAPMAPPTDATPAEDSTSTAPNSTP